MHSRSLVTVTLLAFVTIAALLSCSTRSRPTDDTSSLPAPPQIGAPSAEAPAVPSGSELPGRVIGLDFADERHAFAVLADCADGQPYGAVRDCSYQVAVLDGGAAWELREAPLPDADLLGMGVTVEAAAPGHARLDAVVGGGGEERAWRTTDGGRSWQATGTEPAGSVGRIPDGATVTSAAGYQLAVLMPQTAEYRLLDPQPPLSELGPPGRLPDGRHWVAGLDPGTGVPALAVSGDRGAGWRTLAPLPTAAPFVGSVSHRELELTAGPDGLYAFETGMPVGGAEGDAHAAMFSSALLGIHHSTDDGRSWERVWTHTSGSRPASVMGTPIAAYDGSLVVYADDAIYASRDGGHSFTVERPGPPPEEPGLTRAGYLLTDLDHPGHYRISADGFSWHTIVLGGEEA